MQYIRRCQSVNGPNNDRSYTNCQMPPMQPQLICNSPGTFIVQRLGYGAAAPICYGHCSHTQPTQMISNMCNNNRSYTCQSSQMLPIQPQLECNSPGTFTVQRLGYGAAAPIGYGHCSHTQPTQMISNMCNYGNFSCSCRVSNMSPCTTQFFPSRPKLSPGRLVTRSVSILKVNQENASEPAETNNDADDSTTDSDSSEPETDNDDADSTPDSDFEESVTRETVVEQRLKDGKRSGFTFAINELLKLSGKARKEKLDLLDGHPSREGGIKHRTAEENLSMKTERSHEGRRVYDRKLMMLINEKVKNETLKPEIVKEAEKSKEQHNLADIFGERCTWASSGHPASSRSRSCNPQKIIQPTIAWENVKLRTIENAWKPISRGAQVSNNESTMKKVRGLLNKITRGTFDDLKNVLLAIELNDDKIRHEIVDMVFDKAVEDPQYSSLYSDLCAEVVKQELGSTDMDENIIELQNYMEMQKLEVNPAIESVTEQPKSDQQKTLQLDKISTSMLAAPEIPTTVSKGSNSLVNSSVKPPSYQSRIQVKSSADSMRLAIEKNNSLISQLIEKVDQLSDRVTCVEKKIL